MRVLAVCDYFLPGFKAGGPIKSLANLIRQLHTEIDFLVITRDRDLLDTSNYEGLVQDQWITRDDCQVWYLSPSRQSLRGILRASRSAEFDFVYLNSFFSRLSIRVLILRRLHLMPMVPVLIAPRGEFSPGALSLKSLRKKYYLFLAKNTGLLSGAKWHATSEQEVEDIRHEIGNHAEILIAPNLHCEQYGSSCQKAKSLTKEPGEARIVFLSRISPKKNLDLAIRALRGVKGNITFDVVGPIEESSYWECCNAEIEKLPANIQCRYLGTVPPGAVRETLGRYHFFLLPTRGENFGHAIIEALLAGLPVIISDKTPWRDLVGKGAGWDVPIDDEEQLTRVLNHCVEMDDEKYVAISISARRLGESIQHDPLSVSQTRALFL